MAAVNNNEEPGHFRRALTTRQRSRSRSWSPAAPRNLLTTRRSSMPPLAPLPAPPPAEGNKTQLCHGGFLTANYYKGPYGKHIASIVQMGTVCAWLGLVMAVIGFCVKDSSQFIQTLKVLGTILLTLGLVTCLSVITVYKRAKNSDIPGTSGRVNLQSIDVILKIFMAISLCLLLLGFLITPMSYALSEDINKFEYFKVIGIGYLCLGLLGFVSIAIYVKNHNLNCFHGYTSNEDNHQQPHLSSTNSEIPRVWIVPSETESDTGIESEIPDIFGIRSFAMSSSTTSSIIPFEPPPYAELDPHSGSWSEAASTVNSVSATQSMVTLLQYSYAEDTESLPPPPPYEEVMATLVQEAVPGDDPTSRRPSAISQNSMIVVTNTPSLVREFVPGDDPISRRPSAISQNSMIVVTNTPSQLSPPVEQISGESPHRVRYSLTQTVSTGQDAELGGLTLPQ